ncbi:MAG: aminoacetone oxidase family FAD-binding enzyme [Planctomycetota bacterium]
MLPASAPSEVSPDSADVAIVGGGAAGLMAAIFAARSGARTVLLEGGRALGLKILISGGGRCNVLPSVFCEDDYFTTGSRAVLRRLFRTWPLTDVHRFFNEDLAVDLVIEAGTGKVFPASQRADEIRDALYHEAQRAGTTVLTGWRVQQVEPPTSLGSTFRLRAVDGRQLAAARVILATGGKSLPRTGSDGGGYELARALGHTILAPYPALVPLFTDDPGFLSLSGISLPVEWSVRRDGKIVERRVRELLFTHRGFSGPAILDASHWSVRDRAPIEIQWADAREEWQERLTTSGRRTVVTTLTERLPRRLVELLCARAGVAPDTAGNQLRREDRKLLLDQLCQTRLPVTGDEGYRKAEVTGGGVPVSEVNPSTLESRSQPGLYLCGEILDVIGRIGGYNFLWAWVTGRLAGESATTPRSRAI